ncbi:hypothetical protein THAOC_28159 [Thalassiosira oceanica]|uniref:Uncharacterized protein n=1 Tax=Thalassiosira oceanica TaxID=159749 RepID=K0RJV9_THAOC|nr:hypothetical protein THAOC_28159 [Thalassiosira oceanica]|eukprot:EJK52549.1 hypothetical protein THAOC_28159 [Thalassiosira oceanica]
MPDNGDLADGTGRWERIGVQPCVEGGRIRQYTAACGAPVVQTPEAIGYEARGWRGRSAGWELGCIARASAFESVSALNTKPLMNEDILMRRWTGRLVFRNRLGHSKAAGGRRPAFTRSLLAGEGARDMGQSQDMGPLSRIELE